MSLCLKWLFLLGRLKAFKGKNCGGVKRDEVSKISDKIRVQPCQNRHNIPNLLRNSALQQAPTSRRLLWPDFL